MARLSDADADAGRNANTPSCERDADADADADEHSTSLQLYLHIAFSRFCILPCIGNLPWRIQRHYRRPCDCIPQTTFLSTKTIKCITDMVRCRCSPYLTLAVHRTWPTRWYGHRPRYSLTRHAILSSTTFVVVVVVIFMLRCCLFARLLP
jgi:hypothetical protein